jgi:hypothetical protein
MCVCVFLSKRGRTTKKAAQQMKKLAEAKIDELRNAFMVAVIRCMELS